jgi:hypothetical protein
LEVELTRAGLAYVDSPAYSAAEVPLEVFQKPQFIDYGKPEAFQADVAYSQECVANAEPPSCTSAAPQQATYVVKPRELCDYGRGVANIGELVAVIFRNRHRGIFFGYRCVQRCYPSNGSRHGFEVTLKLTYQELVINAYYDPETNVYRVDAPAPAERRLVRVEMILGMHWERHFWRYRHSWYYNTVLLEVGHILASLEMLAHEYKTTFSMLSEQPFGINPHDPWVCPFLILEMRSSGD